MVRGVSATVDMIGTVDRDLDLGADQKRLVGKVGPVGAVYRVFICTVELRPWRILQTCV